MKPTLSEKIILTLLSIIIGIVSFSWKQETDARLELLNSVIQLRIDQAETQTKQDASNDKLKDMNSRISSLEERVGEMNIIINGIKRDPTTPVFGR